MGCYIFKCRKCDEVYEELTNWDEDRKWPNVRCPQCDSATKEQQLTCCGAVIFTNPRGTSKADSFSYVAGWNMENAKGERRAAESKSHMGGTDDIYRKIDDISSGKNENFRKI